MFIFNLFYEQMKRSWLLAILLLYLICAFLGSASAFALGLGEAKSESFLGQALSIRIPILNAVKPDTLKLGFESEQIRDQEAAKVNIQIDRSQSIFAIRITSKQAFNEPYLNFKLMVNNNGAESARNFSVLIDPLPAQKSNSNGKSVSVSQNDSPINLSTVNNLDSLSSSKKFKNESIMGPYDTAVSGQIPARFGAVLDGQSLWRVARRINKAMNVSKSQMMWALYEANPAAFSTKKIDSLIAGSYLNIPAQAIVSQVSHDQAKQNLAALRNGSATPLSEKQVVAKEPLDNVPDTTKTVSQNATKKLEEQVQELKPRITGRLNQGEASKVQPFQVTPISQAANDRPATLQGQSIIASLTETVGNMSQQIEHKDKKIEFLEAQVQELKKFIRTEKNSGQVQNPQTDSQASFVSDNVDEANGSPITRSEKATNWLNYGFFIWLLMGLLLFSMVAYLLRDKIANIIYELNLTGEPRDMEFSVVDTVHEPSIDTDNLNQAQIESHTRADTINVEADEQNDEEIFSEEDSVNFEIDYDADQLENVSIMSEADSSHKPINENSKTAQKKAESIRVVKPSLAKSSYEVSSNDEEIDETIEHFSELIFSRNKNGAHDFTTRYEALLKQENYIEANELLEFARYNEIDEERYHYERLQLLAMTGAEEAFYEYYSAAEDKISTFDPSLQRRISELVLNVAKVK